MFINSTMVVPEQVPSEDEGQKFLNRVFSGNWDTSQPAPEPKLVDIALDDTCVHIGEFKKDLKPDDPDRAEGAPAFMKVVAEAKTMTYQHKICDAKGGYASADDVAWDNPAERLDVQDAINLALKAELAIVKSIEGWNKELAVFKARQRLIRHGWS
jgi:hypothetical protein